MHLITVLRQYKNEFLKASLSDSIFLGLNAALAFSLPLRHTYSNIALLLLSILFLFRLKKIREIDSHGRLFIGSSIVFVIALFIVSLRSYHSFGLALKEIEQFGLIAAIPLIMTCSSKQNQKLIRIIPWSFTTSITLALLYCFILGAYKFFFEPLSHHPMNSDNINAVTSSWNYISYSALLAPIDLSPSYASLFATFSFFHIAHETKMYSKNRIGHYLLLIFFLIMISLIGSRIGFLSLILGSAFFLFQLFRERKMNIIRIIIIGAVAICISGIILSNDFTKKKFVEDFKSLDTNNDALSWNSTKIRLAIWKSSLHIIKDHPIIGVGMQKHAREPYYNKYSFNEVFIQYPNAHNQYLEFLVMGGIPLFAIFLLYLVTAFKIASKKHNDLFFLLFIIILTHFLAECILNRINGTFFITYFISYFVYLFRPDTSKNETA